QRDDPKHVLSRGHRRPLVGGRQRPPSFVGLLTRGLTAMESRIDRRDFLKTAPAAAALVTAATEIARTQKQTPAAAATKRAAAGYQIRPIAFSDVTMTDAFWKPKIDVNATVTIPFEFSKADTENGGRGPSQNVLQAAIYSLQTHPDPALQAKVDARIHEI